MSGIESTSDLTGALSQTDLNTQDIQNIIDEYNKFQDQLTGGNIRQDQQDIVVFDDTTNRVLIGYQTVLQLWGIFVSQPGIDVTQATADQMLFYSNQSVLNVVTEGTVSVPSASVGAGTTNTRTGSISYTLPQPYDPLILATTVIGGGGTYLWQGFVPLNFTVGSGTGVTMQSLDILSTSIGSTGATFSAQFFNGSAGTLTAPSYQIKYYVLQQQSQ